MSIITNTDELYNLEKNKIIGKFNLVNTEIEFKGSNNILCCKGEVTLENSKIRFTGNNSVIFIDENEHPFSISVRVGNDSVFYLGKHSYLNRTSHMYATERKNIIIGNECLISFGNYLRTADPHEIYDIKTKKRVNNSKSILIGDHVWLGQCSLILKNTVIGSGAIIGGNSVVSGKTIQSNSIYAGNPAKKVKEGVFFPKVKSTHDYMIDDEEESAFNHDDSYIYENDDNVVSLKDIDKELAKLKTADEKLKYLILNISNNENKNRFYIG